MSFNPLPKIIDPIEDARAHLEQVLNLLVEGLEICQAQLPEMEKQEQRAAMAIVLVNDARHVLRDDSPHLLLDVDADEGRWFAKAWRSTNK